ncbi:protein of heat shock protein Hsp70 family [Pseudohyphozyma bogoriensis]|nr:protein of heat shock protein Hsp70 family [Pseudohyphozyma bogoriensis]
MPQIYTMDANDTRAECVVVKNGLVAATGTLKEIREEWGDLDTLGSVGKGGETGVKIYYLKRGQALLPGFIDAHAHILQNGEAASAVDLVGAASVEEVIERIAKFIAKDPKLVEDKSRFILGLGWDQTKWPGASFPTADDLERDPRLAGRPIYLKRIDVHALWVSHAIINKMGDLPVSVPGGLIVRLPNGDASGVFVDNAMTLPLKVIPPWTDADRLTFLTKTARTMLDRGLTGVHDASLSLEDIEFLKRIDGEGRLPIRIYGLVSCEPLNSYCGDEVERYDGDRFVVRGVKLFVDGALGSWGAAMIDPYTDNPEERGILISPAETFRPLIAKGFQVASHGIGDRANQIILDAYAEALKFHEGEDLRPRVEHAQIMRMDDIRRMGELGVISSFQPTHATSDMGYAEKRVGSERIKGAYAWASLVKSGSRIALGSDFPVESVDPLLGIYAAVSRLWLNGDSPHGPGGWYPSERLSLLETLRGFTIDAAYASFQEGRVGSLEKGKEADFVMFDRAFEDVEVGEIPRMKLSLVSLLSLLALLPPSFAASLLAVDYGTDSFKASLVKPGVPFDVLINKDSKRKTPALLTIRGEDRSFGGEAANLATRFPQFTFSSIKLLLGHPSTHPQAALHNSLYNTPPSTTARGSPAISSYPVEEILAQQLVYAKEMAEEAAGESVRDTVITVPAWFGQSERQAVLDAIELAGLRSIGLVNDGTAAAVNYAMTRTFAPEPTYHLLYDFGAGSLRTTLVSLKSALLPDPLSLAAKPELKNVTSLTVHGVGHDLDVGGYVFDRIVRDLLKDEFEKTGPKVEGDKRAMAKLLKEAGRVKQVLSANVESMGRIEGLINDIDLRATISRQQLEDGAAHLLPKFTQPIHDAFVGTNLTLDDVASVILVGGSSRVPMVEAAVRAAVGEDKIAKNVNADEAAVMGAALYGAGITRGFRTKDIRVQDVTPFSIDVAYEADKTDEETDARIVSTHLFDRLAKTGVKKTLTFKKTSDFSLQFTTSDPDLELFSTTVSGLDKAFTNLTEDAIANATVKVTIELNESNIVGVSKAVVILKEEDDKSNETLNDKLKGFLGKFGGSKDKEGEPVDPDSPKVENPFEDADDKEATKAKLEELLRAATPANSTVKLTTTTVAVERTPMSAEEKSDSRRRLRDLKTAETRKLAREEARNVLEAYIYKVRDMVESPVFVDASLESERKIIKEKNDAAGDWLWESDEAETKEFKSRKSELEKLVKHITVRTAEATQRPQVIEAFKTVLYASDLFLTSAKSNHTIATSANEPSKFTTEELDAFEKSISAAKGWFEETVKKQEGLKGTDDPVLKAKDVEGRAKELKKEMDRLEKKKAPRKKKVLSSEKTAKDEPKPKEEKEEGERKKDELSGTTSPPLNYIQSLTSTSTQSVDQTLVALEAKKQARLARRAEMQARMQAQEEGQPGENEEHEKAASESGDSFKDLDPTTPPNSSPERRSPWKPRLQVVPPSDSDGSVRAPTIPGTPEGSIRSSTSSRRRRKDSIDSSPQQHAPPSSPRPKPLAIAEIPPYKPKSPSNSPPMSPTLPPASPKMSPLLLERLRETKHAKERAAAEAAASAATPAAAPAPTNTAPSPTAAPAPPVPVAAPPTPSEPSLPSPKSSPPRTSATPAAEIIKPASPPHPREKKTATRSIYDPDTKEDYVWESAELSTLAEESERSSFSTGSYGVFRTNSTSTTGRQMADGSYSAVGTGSGSASSKNSSWLKNAIPEEMEPASVPSSSQGRSGSPTRRINPELAKRMAKFEEGGGSAGARPESVKSDEGNRRKAKEVFGRGEVRSPEDGVRRAPDGVRRETSRESFGTFGSHVTESSGMAGERPREEVRWEGWVSVPTHKSSLKNVMRLPHHEWRLRYAVLTEELFEYRPTDHEPGPHERELAFRIGDVVKTEPFGDFGTGNERFCVVKVDLPDGDWWVGGFVNRRSRVLFMVEVGNALERWNKFEPTGRPLPPRISIKGIDYGETPFGRDMEVHSIGSSLNRLLANSSSENFAAVSAAGSRAPEGKQRARGVDPFTGSPTSSIGSRKGEKELFDERMITHEEMASRPFPLRSPSTHSRTKGSPRLESPSKFDDPLPPSSPHVGPLEDFEQEGSIKSSSSSPFDIDPPKKERQRYVPRYPAVVVAEDDVGSEQNGDLFSTAYRGTSRKNSAASQKADSVVSIGSRSGLPKPPSSAKAASSAPAPSSAHGSPSRQLGRGLDRSKDRDASLADSGRSTSSLARPLPPSTQERALSVTSSEDLYRHPARPLAPSPANSKHASQATATTQPSVTSWNPRENIRGFPQNLELIKPRGLFNALFDTDVVTEEAVQDLKRMLWLVRERVFSDLEERGAHYEEIRRHGWLLEQFFGADFRGVRGVSKNADIVNQIVENGILLVDLADRLVAQAAEEAEEGQHSKRGAPSLLPPHHVTSLADMEELIITMLGPEVDLHDVQTLFDNDAKSINTRAGIHDAAEAEAWRRQRSEYEAQRGNTPKGDDVSRTDSDKVRREAAVNKAARRLAGEQVSPNDSPTSLPPIIRHRDMGTATSPRQTVVTTDYDGYGGEFSVDDRRYSKSDPLPDVPRHGYDRAWGSAPSGEIPPVLSPAERIRMRAAGRPDLPPPSTANAPSSKYSRPLDAKSTDPRPNISEPASRWSEDTADFRNSGGASRLPMLLPSDSTAYDYGSDGRVLGSRPGAGELGKSSGRRVGSDSRSEQSDRTVRTGHTNHTRTESYATVDLPKPIQDLLRDLRAQIGQRAESERGIKEENATLSSTIREMLELMQQDRQRRDEEWQHLMQTVGTVREQVAGLPNALLARLTAAEEAARVATPVQPTMDMDTDGMDLGATLDDAVLGDGRVRGFHPRFASTPTPGPAAPEEPIPGVDPQDEVLAGVFELGRKLSQKGDMGAGKNGSRKVKGPRMPMTILGGQRLWGGPKPVDDARDRWAGGHAAQRVAAEEELVEKAVEHNEKTKKATLVAEALRDNEELSQALETLATSGDIKDPGVLSMALFEILRTTKQLAEKQAEQEKLEKEKAAKALTKEERAELEAKKNETARLEALLANRDELTTGLQKQLEELAAKGASTEATLTQLKEFMANPKAAEMDPAITDAVRRMYQEVGKLRDEKKTLQGELADLLAFKSKQEGGKGAAAPAKAAPAEKSGGGFFGPRAPKG